MIGLLGAIVIGSASVLALDTVGSLAARRGKVRYVALAPVSHILWGLAGALGGLSVQFSVANRILVGAAAAGVVGLVDVTLGWWIAWQLGPGRVPPERATARRLIRVGAVVTMRAVAYGAIGGAVGALLGAHLTIAEADKAPLLIARCARIVEACFAA